ncbi:TIM barrel protein [Mesorhizobium sp. M00.F.Ca.ET.220.01.1.1]|uniref:sugar phosphate isomerase/epimerase family protein n=1 Tax=Mesorhizobium sp. M00.F.Ca.ET.220.01.1.1 TaxID=2500531 RepID=UPI0010938D35|nr:TIM barrel protein [Mesorhizobium sp. M00.F.Ca.ET.220.01.1.1]TGQ24527.1 erythrose 4-phosphate dehydrogenase [Mesorhizobium sp. M00.F.Ca.ET.220.01.1.1]
MALSTSSVTISPRLTALCESIPYDIGIRDVQLTHEFVNPGWPAATIAKFIRLFRAALDRTGVRVTSGMTGPYGRLNHFGHPDSDVRRYYVDWFKIFADISAELGATSMGTQFAIFTHQDYDDPKRRARLLDIAMECWREVAEHAKAAGLTYLFWEPMSVGREFGHTIENCRALHEQIEAANLSIPLLMMVDIDHGDVTSSNPDDVDPYAWAEAFPRQSPIIHIKQSSMNKGGHWPFTAAYNKDGRITPQKLLETVRRGGGTDNEICLELSFREREPVDHQVVAMIRESVDYWAPFIDAGRWALSPRS